MTELQERWPYEAPRTWSRLHVLVVEPYASGRDTICTCIEELGYTAVGACSVEHATRLVADEPVELLIVAHCLPWIDGWGFLAGLPEQRYVPAIIVCDALDDRPDHGTLVMRPTFSLEDLELAIGSVAWTRRPSSPLSRRCRRTQRTIVGSGASRVYAASRVSAR